MRCARAAWRSTVPASTRPWPSRRPRPAPRGRGRATRRQRRTLVRPRRRASARPNSPAIRATKARAWCWPSSRTAAGSTSAEQGETVDLLLNQTPFYGESGGQVGDTGKLTTLKGFEGEVEDTSKPLGKLHVLRTKVVKGEVSVGETRPPDGRRRAPRPGPRQSQRDAFAPRRAAPPARRPCHPEGQPGRARLFPLRLLAPAGADPRGDRGGRGRGERADPRQRAGDDPADDARRGDRRRRDGAVRREIWRRGARAQHGPRHAEADYSVELCGGTHVRALGDIQLLKIISESAVSSGVRRIEALTGEAARQWLGDRDARLREAAATLKASPDEVPARVAALVEERRRLERELAEAKKALAMGGGAAKADDSGAGEGRRPQFPRPGGRRPRSQGACARPSNDEAAGRLGRRGPGRGQ